MIYRLIIFYFLVRETSTPKTLSIELAILAPRRVGDNAPLNSP